MAIVVLGIDLGKNTCSLAGTDASGRVVLRRRLRRGSVMEFVCRLGPCVVAMEACCGAHHLGRVFRARGHEVRLMSPEYVRPYGKAQKNDDPWDRDDRRDGPGGGGGRCPNLQAGPGHGGLARLDAATDDDRRQTPAAWHQQAG